MKAHITITSKRVKTTELKELLEQHLDLNVAKIVLEVRRRKLILRGLDPTVLVAIVGASGAGLGALITGLLQIAEQKSTGMIIIQSKGGSRLEVPVGVSSEELEMLIEKVKKLDLEDVKISLP